MAVKHALQDVAENRVKHRPVDYRFVFPLVVLVVETHFTDVKAGSFLSLA